MKKEKIFYVETYTLNPLVSELFGLGIMTFLFVHFKFWTVLQDGMTPKFFGLLIILLLVVPGLFYSLKTRVRMPSIKKPYLTLSENGLVIGGGEIVPWELIKVIRIGGFSDKGLRRRLTHPSVSLTLVTPQIPKGQKFLKQDPKNNHEFIFLVEGKHIHNRSLIKAFREFSPPHVKFFTPLGY